MYPEDTMRSDLVFGAMKSNDVFERFTRVNPLASVPRAGNVQSFPCTAQGETHSVVEDLEQSVA
jgi:hypothetical protein